MTISTIFTLLLLPFVFHIANAAVFNIRNNCPYTVWAGAVPGGGRRLNPGQAWSLNVVAGTQGARIWPRTNCNFDGSGQGRCQTGDCNGRLQCKNYGTPPNTLAKYGLNQFNNLDFFDISLVDGFNVPMEFSPTSGRCTRGIVCRADIIGQCPKELRAPGGCNNPCTMFKTDIVTLEIADQLIFQGFSKISVAMLIVTLRMIQLVRLRAPVEPTIKSYFALD